MVSKGSIGIKNTKAGKEKAAALGMSVTARVRPLGAGATRSFYLGRGTSEAALREARSSAFSRSCDSFYRKGSGIFPHCTPVVAVLQRRGPQGAFFRQKGRLSHEGRKRPDNQTSLARSDEEARLDTHELLPMGA